MIHDPECHNINAKYRVPESILKECPDTYSESKRNADIKLSQISKPERQTSPQTATNYSTTTKSNSEFEATTKP